MNKKTLIVIAVLILLPVLITLICVASWNSNNETVAEYGETLDTVIYGKKTLHAVENPDSYMAETGTFLGKVGDKLYGAGLYTLKYDTTGELWALATEKGTVIYTADGKLPASAYGGEKITRIFFDSFECMLTSSDDIETLTSAFVIGSSSVLWTPDEDDENEVVRRSVHYCYDGCAVCASTAGELLYFPYSDKWYFLPPESVTGEGTDEETERLYPLKTYRTLKLLEELFIK